MDRTGDPCASCWGAEPFILTKRSLSIQPGAFGIPKRHFSKNPLQNTICPIPDHPAVDTWVRRFSEKHHSSFQTQLDRARFYAAPAQEIFMRKGLPKDLIYVALVESGFSPDCTFACQSGGNVADRSENGKPVWTGAKQVGGRETPSNESCEGCRQLSLIALRSVWIVVSGACRL